MKLLSLKLRDFFFGEFEKLRPLGPEAWMVFALLLLIFILGQCTLGITDPDVLLPVNLTWLFVLQGMLVFLMVLALCWFLLGRFWAAAGLPDFESMVVQFNKLELWMQLGFYVALFALLVFAAVACLIAIC